MEVIQVRLATIYSSPLIFRQRRAWWTSPRRRYRSAHVADETAGCRHSIKAERLNAGERVVDHKFARSNASGMLVSTFKRLEATATAIHRQTPLSPAGFYQAASDNNAITTTEIDNLTFEILWQICIKKRAPISSPVREKTFAWCG